MNKLKSLTCPDCGGKLVKNPKRVEVLGVDGRTIGSFLSFSAKNIYCPKCSTEWEL